MYTSSTMNDLLEAAKESGLLYLFFVAVQHIINIINQGLLPHSPPENPYVFFAAVTISISLLYYRRIQKIDPSGNQSDL